MKRLKSAILANQPVLIRMAATLVVLFSVTTYLYSVQPALPIALYKEGLVMVKCEKDAAWKGLELKDKLKAGDIIRTAKNTKLDIGLSDRYAIRLNSGTTIKVAKLTPRHGKGRAIFELDEGRIFIDVEGGFKGSRFEVITKAAKATALGTKFSVGVSDKEKPRTKVEVLEGKVKVSGSRQEKVAATENAVVVESGQKTSVSMGASPSAPQRLAEQEWLELEELYQVGMMPKVILLLKNTPDRVEQLLRPCPIYISDDEPRKLPRLIENAMLHIKKAIEDKDDREHLESIRILERVVAGHPNAKYDAQFLLYIGAYYEYMGRHEDAIMIFEKVLAKYPNSYLASIAQAAIGEIYEEKLNDRKKASEAFELVLKRYPNSLEAIWVESKLGIKKDDKML